MSLPTIDFHPYMQDVGVIVGQPPTPEQLDVASALDRACREHGFVYLTGFGLTAELRKAAFQSAGDLFHMDDAYKKENLRRINPNDNMGYAPYRTESLNRSRPNELKEAFNIRFPPAVQNNLKGCPESFIDASAKLRQVFETAIHRYALACAVALGLETDFFARTLEKKNLCTIRFLHAPPCDYAPTSDVDADMPLRVGEHTDFGAFTFLLHDGGTVGADGLQILPVEGGEIGGSVGIGEKDQWQDVELPREKNSLVGAIVNTGALMARWTNDEWRATAHRVIVPTAESAARERFSIACFVDPDKTSIVDVPSNFIGPGQVKKYEPISSLDFLAMKLNEMMVGAKE